jgi:DNA-binding MarR family transcriptional regulator
MTPKRASPHTPGGRTREPRDEAQALADRVHSAAIHLLRRLRREDARTGLTAPRLSALSVLVFGGPRSLGELAAAEQVRPPTMTRLVTALERDGLVVKEGVAGDRRQVQVRATAAGRAMLARGRERRVVALASVIRTLADEDRALLDSSIAVLDRIVGQLGDEGRQRSDS